jgi:hypothetical protein
MDGFLEDYFDWTPPKTPPRILSQKPSCGLVNTWDSTPPQTPENITRTYSPLKLKHKVTITYSPFQRQHKDKLGKSAWNCESPVPHHDGDDDQHCHEQAIEDLQDILATFSEDSCSTPSSGNAERRLAIYGTEDRMLMKEPTDVLPVFDRMMDWFDPLRAEACTSDLTQEETFDTLPSSFSDDDEEDTFLPCCNSDALDVCIDDTMGVATPEESTRWRLLRSQESLLGSEESESDLFLQLEEPKHNDVDGTMATTSGESHSRSDSDTYHTFETQEEQEPFRLDVWRIGQAFKM